MRPQTYIRMEAVREATDQPLGTAHRPRRVRKWAARWASARALILCAVAIAPPPTAASCPKSQLAVQVLGSGGPELQDRRASSSYLIWRDGKAQLLFDIGGGAALRFGQSGATVSQLDAIFLTHLHVDHAGDLPALVKSSYFEDRRRPLPLFGPTAGGVFPATTRFVRLLFAAQGAFAYLQDYLDSAAPDSYRLEPHDLTPPEHGLLRIFEAADVRVFAARVIHGEVPALAYRLEVGGLSVAFSGDGDGNNGNLEQLARAADLFVAHNAAPEGASGAVRALHMPPSVIGRIAAAARVKRLVISHRMLRTLGHEQQSTAAIRRSYSGPLTFADDLDCFAVGRP